MKVFIPCFDLSDNAAGRAHLLAQLVAPIAEVEVVGPRHGPDVWPPVAADGVRSGGVPGGRVPRVAGGAPALFRAADGDLLYASKPRLGSAGIGHLKRLIGR